MKDDLARVLRDATAAEWLARMAIEAALALHGEGLRVPADLLGDLDALATSKRLDAVTVEDVIDTLGLCRGVS